MCLWGFLSFHALNAQPQPRGGTPIGAEPHQEPTRPTWSECTSPDPSLNPCIQTSCDNALRPRISTNPAAPSNVLRPDLINNFDWQPDRLYPIQGTNPAISGLMNPVYQESNNSIIRNRFSGLDQKEIFNSDGWELISKDLGGIHSRIGQTVESPNIVLYNRRSGILRVFVARGLTRAFETNFAEVRAYFASDGNRTTLLDAYNGETHLRALDVPFSTPTFASNIMEIINNPGSWSYADFIMTYDPCTCFFKNMWLTIEIHNVDRTTLTLSGTIIGSLTHQGTPIRDDGTQKGTSFSGVETNLVNFSKNYVKGYTSLFKFFDESKE